MPKTKRTTKSESFTAFPEEFDVFKENCKKIGSNVSRELRGLITKFNEEHK